MKINFDFKATNIEMTEAIREYLYKRLEKLEKFTGDDAGSYGQVEIGTTTSGQHSGDIFRAEINLTVEGQNFRTESKKKDLYSAIDEAQDEMIRTLKSYRGKRRTLFRRGGYQIKKLLKFRGKKL